MTEIIKKRFLAYLIWQSIPTSFIYLISKTLILSLFTPHFFTFSLYTPLSFLTYHLSLLLFSYSLSTISSPHPTPHASLPQIASSLVRFIFNSVLGSPNDVITPSFRLRVKTSVGVVFFVAVAVVSGFVGVVCLCRNDGLFDGLELVGLGFRGVVFGLVYGVYYVYYRRWVLAFPIIQRPPFFSFKMELPSAIRNTLKLSSLSFLCSAVVVIFLPDQFKSKNTIWKFIIEQIIFYVGSTTVCLSWELSHHLHQVVHTKRCTFAPPKGSAAAETNPSDPLLAALEESTPKSLLQYLAYLDLCMTCESNVDTWRRAAFFEETGETYRKVVTLCLRPLENMTSNLVEGLEGNSMEKAHQLSHQLRSPTDTVNELKLDESFNEFQLCVWCARTVSALTARSHRDDRFGVAQLSGSNASIVSTLLSCLLAVEACMGKKTHLQVPQAMDPTSIRWATLSTSKRDAAPPSVLSKRRGGPLHGKAYAMADVLRTSVYIIVSVFHDEMVGSTNAGSLEKDWITDGKLLCGSRELLVQKLSLFLDFQAC